MFLIAKYFVHRWSKNRTSLAAFSNDIAKVGVNGIIDTRTYLILLIDDIVAMGATLKYAVRV
jgi:predicted phosphoribosyltransferase